MLSYHIHRVSCTAGFLVQEKLNLVNLLEISWLLPSAALYFLQVPSRQLLTNLEESKESNDIFQPAFMHQSHHNFHFQCLTIPIGKSKRVTLIIHLPAAGFSFNFIQCKIYKKKHQINAIRSCYLHHFKILAMIRMINNSTTNAS